MAGKLYLCATPIGNLGDITLRTLEVLRSVDLIAAEDTRVSIKLLNHFGINKPLTSYYEHNKREKGQYLLQKLLVGLSVAVITDAGMPGISDPGEDLVKLCIAHQVPLEVLPGPCAFATALVGSGLATGRFAFEGFLSVNKKSRMQHLKSIRQDTRTLIFYEAPHKLRSTLQDMYAVLGERRIVLARELTKRFEEYIRTTFTEALLLYEETAPKGEFIILIEGASAADLEEERRAAQPQPQDLLAQYAKGGERGKALVSHVAEELGLPKKEVYACYLKWKAQ